MHFPLDGYTLYYILKHNIVKYVNSHLTQPYVKVHSSVHGEICLLAPDELKYLGALILFQGFHHLITQILQPLQILLGHVETIVHHCVMVEW